MREVCAKLGSRVFAAFFKFPSKIESDRVKRNESIRKNLGAADFSSLSLVIVIGSRLVSGP